MLKTFRGALSGVTGWLVLALVILAFAFVGIGALDTFSGSSAVRVGDTRFTAQELDREFARQIELQRQETGEVLSREEAVSRGLLTRTINQFVIRGLFAEEAERLGLAVTDPMIQKFLQDQYNAGAEPGDTQLTFDRDALARVLQANRMSLGEFRQIVEFELLRAQIDDALMLPTPAPEPMAEFFVLRQTEERTVSTAMLEAPEIEAPTDEDLRSFYASNAERYRSPELREYTMVVLDENVVADRIEIPESDVRQLFEARAAAMGTPERRSYAQVQFPTLEAAEAALAALEEGASLEAIAEDAGLAVTTFDDEVRTNIADEAVAEAVFGVDSPQVVGPVDGVFGALVADVREITPGETVDYEELRDGLEDELREEIVTAELDNLYDEMQDAGDSGASLADIASEFGLPVRTVGPADADFFAEGGAIESNVPSAAHQLAFSMSPGGLFEAVDTAEGGYAFVELINVTPSAPRPFEEVKDEVSTAFIEQQRRETMRTRMAAVEAAVEAGTSFAEALAPYEAEPTTRTLSGFQPVDSIPQALLGRVYDARIGEVVTQMAPDAQTATLVYIDDLSFGANERFVAQVEQAKAQLGQALSAELYQAYLTAMQDEIGVRQNEAQIAERFAVTP